MEPRHSMTGYAIVVAIGLVLLAGAGLADVAMSVAVGLFLVGAAFDGGYRLLVRRSAPAGRRIPNHRRRLDVWVRAQWIGASLAGLAAALLSSAAGAEPLEHAGRLVDTLLVGLVTASIGIFLSSLVDWYLILPRVSGIAGPAPCEKPGQERWRYVTCIWYFHRALATAIVYGVAVGIPAFMGSTTSGNESGAWFGVATGIAAVAGVFLRESFRAGWHAFNPPVHVGDLIHARVEDDSDDDVAERWRRAYVVDVSLQGAKCKLLADGRYAGERFASKHDAMVSNETLPRRKVAAGAATPLCTGESCCGVNWYCRRNPAAHD
jgi:hypothetical protein